MWEHYADIDDYLKSMAKVCWFNDLMSFTVAWNSIPHKSLTNLFYDSERKEVKYVKVKLEKEEKETRINGLSLFLNEVHPSYEDEVNKQGGEFRMDFKSHLPFLQTIWEKLVYALVTGEFKHAEMISGVRLLDKSLSGKENFFRFEIWTKFGNNQQAMLQEMQKHLEEEYIKLMYEDEKTENSKNKGSQENLNEWIRFQNH